MKKSGYLMFFASVVLCLATLAGCSVPLAIIDYNKGNLVTDEYTTDFKFPTPVTETAFFSGVQSVARDEGYQVKKSATDVDSSGAHICGALLFKDTGEALGGNRQIRQVALNLQPDGSTLNIHVRIDSNAKQPESPAKLATDFEHWLSASVAPTH